ncbi:related to NADH:flavin oxidoreductase/12-oxophytodienoate reductase [Armillaria ostoyae]|uniref:Related to NADH:flavin oxidoreductase/12-oxophytodienoate reductase n=1 Tax=Armillaria ostoyae TaxID=47428 RepID=A0A284R8U7_ARMOS|nr:related to NADH:flavin oxidoreductase/12-oxophytodienoate reductase [Armillaria ostoyae]
MAPKLFQPTQVGSISLNHRVVLAPLTRFRASKEHIPHVRIVKEYYEQRAHSPGTLLITEATYIDERTGGYDNVPGIWNEHQIDAWKEITDAVHAKGSYIFCQLWALGRSADPKVLASKGLPYVSASDVKLSSETVAPRPLTVEEIQEYVELYAQAARNAISAGFDGVEIHGANSYLLDQFTRDVTNRRTDIYGGSIENRVRFPLEVVDAVAEAIGPERVGYRVSPWNNGTEMKMVDPKPTFGYLASQLKARQPKLAYLHVVEPRMIGLYDRKDEDIGVQEENDFIRSVWSPKLLISAGGYDRQSAIDTAENKGDLIAFGRHFISNPDLVYRLENNVALSAYNRKTFYLPGEVSSTGYTDYPFAEEDYTAKSLL